MEISELSKRLLALMQGGVYLIGLDGHVWIMSDEEEYDGTNIERILRDAGIEVNSKVYYGVLQALDIIDAALKAAGSPTLLERYEQYVQHTLFLGKPGADTDRFTFLGEGKGGIN